MPRIAYWPALESQEDYQRQKAYADWHFAGLDVDIALPRNRDEATIAADDAGIIIYWQKAHYLDLWADVLAGPGDKRRGVSLDPFADIAPSEDYARLALQFYRGDIPLLAEDALRKTSEAFIIGTGPHDDITPKPSGSCAIYIGSAICDVQRCAALPPDWIILADGPSQLGHLPAAEMFRARLFALLEQHPQCRILAPDFALPSVLAHWPEHMAKRVYVLPEIKSAAMPPSLIDDQGFAPTGNVLTGLALPLAAELAPCIHFIGISLSPGSSSAFAHTDKDGRARRLSSILSREPGALATGADYHAAHFARLSAIMAQYQAKGVRFPDMTVAPNAAAEIAAPRSRWLSRFFPAFSAFQTLPMAWQGALIAALFSGVFVLGASIMDVSGESFATIVYLMIPLIIAFIAMTGLFLRARQNRLMAELEHRLSRQQAAQFENLSTRLEAIEQKILSQK